MTELDVEGLKQRLEDVPEGGMLCIDRADVGAIIAALEDRDRLRAVATAAQAWADARFHGRHEAPQIKALLNALAALEGRDG